MKKKHLFFCFLFIFFISPAKAQWLIGGEFGLGQTHVSIGGAKDGFYNNHPSLGYRLSVFGEYSLSKYWAFRSGACWTQKNYKISRGTPSSFYFDGFIEFPLMLKFSIPFEFYLERELFTPFLTIGTYLGYWVLAYEKGTLPPYMQRFQFHPYSQKYEFSEAKDKRLEVGILLSLGLEYKFGANHFLFEGRYSLALTDRETEHLFKTSKKRNIAFIFSIGYMYEV